MSSSKSMVAKTDIIPAVDTKNPLSIDAWPQWLSAMAEMVGTYGTPVIPRGLSLSLSRRQAIEKCLREFRAVMVPATESERGKVLLKISAMPHKERSDLEEDLVVEMYDEAVNDQPVWALEWALRAWNRGEAGKLVDDVKECKWAPAPAIFRMMCLTQQAKIQHRIRQLERLLTAEVDREEDPVLAARIGGQLRELADKLGIDTAEKIRREKLEDKERREERAKAKAKKS